MKNIISAIIVLFFASIAFGQFDSLDFLDTNNNEDNTPKTIEDLVFIETISQYNTVTTGTEFGIAVVLTLDPSGHLYANKQMGEFTGIATEIKPKPIDGVTFGPVVYPKGKEKIDKGEKYLGYVDEITIFVPVRIEDDILTDAIDFEIEYNGLFCTDDTGSCNPWNGTIKLQVNFDANIEAIGLEQNTIDDEWPALTFTPIEANAIGTAPWILLLTALVSGFLLNLMPCVLPVIPLKVLSLIQQGQVARESGDKYKSLKLSLIFALGILAVFGVLGGIMSALGMFYGQQFQSETFKFFMLMIIFILSLSMLGMFEITLPGKVTNVHVSDHGYFGAFMMGVLATLLATPCSAPLLGPALSWSLSQETWVTIATFLIIGTGMALPYVILTGFPKLIDKVPAAGPWMLTLKTGLGFVMVGVAIYLLFLFKVESQKAMASFCLVITFALWLAFKVVTPITPTNKKIGLRLTALVILVLGGYVCNGMIKTETYEKFSEAKLNALLDEGKNVYVEFTADWCPNCKYIESTVLSRDEFQQKLKDNNIEFIVADLTHEDKEVKTYLEKLGSKSVPFTAVFSAKDPDNPVILRDIYTLQSALDAMDKVK
ncbi:MAG: thioredoxin family protein [Phycisphaerae bacterium]|nr:thioredoxin family protein [Phycisphaerae bacterium]